MCAKTEKYTIVHKISEDFSFKCNKLACCFF